MRRRLGAALVLIVMGSTAPAAANDFPYGQTLAFAIYRNGQEIGQHRLSFQNDGGNRTVTVAIDLAVKAMGVTAYRYVHDSREVWNGNALQALELEDRRQRQEVRGACAARRRRPGRRARDGAGNRSGRRQRPGPAAARDQPRSPARQTSCRRRTGTSTRSGNPSCSTPSTAPSPTPDHAVGREPVKTATGTPSRRRAITTPATSGWISGSTTAAAG